MKQIFISAFAAFAMTGVTTVALSGAFAVAGVDVAYAQSAKSLIDAAKADGDVGEQIDGYLAVVAGKSPSAAVRRAVQEINIGRKSVYTSRARQENVTVEAIAASIGVRQLQKARRGETVRDSSGEWKTK